MPGKGVARSQGLNQEAGDLQGRKEPRGLEHRIELLTFEKRPAKKVGGVFESTTVYSALLLESCLAVSLMNILSCCYGMEKDY